MSETSTFCKMGEVSINGLTQKEHDFCRAVATKVVQARRSPGFQVSNEDSKRISDWIGTHEPAPEGAIGGRYTYSFTPTGLGDIFKVIDNITGEELDLTDTSNW